MDELLLADHNQQPAAGGLGLVETKLLAAAVLFTVTLLFGYLPTRLILNQTLVQYAMFAGGGVLMATAFCHLIPEAHESYHNSHQHHSHNHAHEHNHNHNHNQTTFTNVTASLINSTTSTLATLAPTTTIEPPTTTPAPEPEPNPHPHNHDHKLPYLEICLCSGFFFMYIIEQLMMRFINNHSHQHPCDSSTGQLVVSSSQSVTSLTEQGGGAVSSAASSASGAKLVVTSDGHGEHHHAEGHRSRSGSLSAQHAGHLYKFLRGFLIISAFLLHSIFEGVSIGSQTDENRVWTLLFAIGCHKFIIAAVVGLEIYATTLESNLWTFIHMTLFSLMSPIGILLVILAQGTMNVSESDPTMILIQSFATGTVLYIVFVEILQHDNGSKSSDRNRIGKSISLVFGFLLMLVILQVNGNALGCSFYELPIDQKYVKYQSTLNSSWYIGFDKNGNPISGHVSIKRDGSRESLSRERCYQFSKLNSLPTDTRLFPDAKKHIHQQLANYNTSKSKLSTSSTTTTSSRSNNNTTTDIINTNNNNNNITSLATSNILDENNNNNNRQQQIVVDSSSDNIGSGIITSSSAFQSLADVADLLHSRGPQVHLIHQSSLIDMNRYRNILRYQLKRKLGQSLVAINDSNNQTDNSTTNNASQ